MEDVVHKHKVRSIKDRRSVGQSFQPQLQSEWTHYVKEDFMLMVGYYMRRFTWLMYCTYRETHHWAFDFIAWFQRSNFITLFIRGVKHFLLSHNIWHHAVLNSAVSSRLKSITDQHHLPEEQPWTTQIKREDKKKKSVLKYKNIKSCFS